jgi:hypothetical protein
MRCQRDPYEAVGVRWGPLTGRQFWLNIGWRLLIVLPLLGWALWEEPESLVRLMSLSGWMQVVLGVLAVVGGWVVGYQLWLTWRAAHVALVLTPAEAWLLQRRGGRVYFERMAWQECLPPEPARGQRSVGSAGRVRASGDARGAASAGDSRARPGLRDAPAQSAGCGQAVARCVSGRTVSAALCAK